MKSIRGLLIDNTKQIVSKVETDDEGSAIKLYFDSVNLVTPKLYMGWTPFRMFCYQYIKKDGNPVLLENNPEKTVLATDTVLVYGCTPKGWARSLDEQELELLQKYIGYESIEFNGRPLVGYRLMNVSRVPEISITGD